MIGAISGKFDLSLATDDFNAGQNSGVNALIICILSVYYMFYGLFLLVCVFFARRRIDYTNVVNFDKNISQKTAIKLHQNAM